VGLHERVFELHDCFELGGGGVHAVHDGQNYVLPGRQQRLAAAQGRRGWRRVGNYGRAGGRAASGPRPRRCEARPHRGYRCGQGLVFQNGLDARRQLRQLLCGPPRPREGPRRLRMRGGRRTGHGGLDHRKLLPRKREKELVDHVLGALEELDAAAERQAAVKVAHVSVEAAEAQAVRLGRHAARPVQNRFYHRKVVAGHLVHKARQVLLRRPLVLQPVLRIISPPSVRLPACVCLCMCVCGGVHLYVYMHGGRVCAAPVR
jgi:hypothetical protein